MSIIEPRRATEINQINSLILPHPIKAVVGAVDCQHWSACIGLGDAPVPLEDDDFRPDLVIDLRPLIQHFLNVLLLCPHEHKQKKRREEEIFN